MPVTTDRRKGLTVIEREARIREWFERHRHDYCVHDSAPPKVWAEYFQFLLDEVEHLRAVLNFSEKPKS